MYNLQSISNLYYAMLTTLYSMLAVGLVFDLEEPKNRDFSNKFFT